MSKRLYVVSVVLLFCGMVFAAEETGNASIKPLAWAVGYDEGLSAKLFLPKNISVNLSVGYTVTGADSVYKQPLNNMLIKIGGAYLLKEFGKLRINAFVDIAESMVEGQLAHKALTGDDMTYYQWNTSGRLGLAPEFFISDHFSFTYKFGAFVTFYGTTYKLNADESGIEKKDDGYTQGGVLGFQNNTPLLFLQNISLYYYF